MHRAKIALGLAIAVVVSICADTPVAQDARTRQEVFNDIMGIIRSNPNELRAPDNDLPNWISELEHFAVGPITDSMRVFIETTAEDRSAAQNTRWAAVRALRLFPHEEELERMRRLLSDDVVNTTAAAIMVEWGYWDEGSPILLEKQAWPFLVDVGPHELVEPILREAAAGGAKTLLSQFGASRALAAYGDTAIGYETARSILHKYLVDFEQPRDTADLGRTTEVASHILERTTAPEDVELLEAALSYPERSGYMRSIAVYALGRRARENQDPLAIAALERAAANSPYSEVVKTALEQLSMIPSELKGGQR